MWNWAILSSLLHPDLPQDEPATDVFELHTSSDVEEVQERLGEGGGHHHSHHHDEVVPEERRRARVVHVQGVRHQRRHLVDPAEAVVVEDHRHDGEGQEHDKLNQGRDGV